VTDDAGTAVTITWEGHSLVLEVQSASQVTGVKAQQLANARPAEGSRRPIVVADRITADARALLSSSGWSWLDLRGQLHLRAPGLLVDTAVRPQTRAVVRTPPPIRGKAGLAVAYWLCAHFLDDLSATFYGIAGNTSAQQRGGNDPKGPSHGGQRSDPPAVPGVPTGRACPLDRLRDRMEDLNGRPPLTIELVRQSGVGCVMRRPAVAQRPSQWRTRTTPRRWPGHGPRPRAGSAAPPKRWSARAAA